MLIIVKILGVPATSEKATFWNWGPTTIWHRIESIEFFSKSFHPTVQLALGYYMQSANTNRYARVVSIFLNKLRFKKMLNNADDNCFSLGNWKNFTFTLKDHVPRFWHPLLHYLGYLHYSANSQSRDLKNYSCNFWTLYASILTVTIRYSVIQF